MKTIVSKLFALLLLTGTVGFFAGCAKDYDDDLRNLEQTTSQNKADLQQEINNVQTTLQNAINTLDQALDQVPDQIADAVADAKEDLEAIDTQLQNNIDALKREIFGEEASDGTIIVNGLKQQIYARILQAENDINARIDELDDPSTGRVTLLENRVNTLEGNVEALQNFMDRMEGYTTPQGTPIKGKIEELTDEDSRLATLIAELDAFLKTDNGTDGVGELTAIRNLIQANLDLITNDTNGLEALDGKITQLRQDAQEMADIAETEANQYTDAQLAAIDYLDKVTGVLSPALQAALRIDGITDPMDLAALYAEVLKITTIEASINDAGGILERIADLETSVNETLLGAAGEIELLKGRLEALETALSTDLQTIINDYVDLQGTDYASFVAMADGLSDLLSDFTALSDNLDQTITDAVAALKYEFTVDGTMEEFTIQGGMQELFDRIAGVAGDLTTKENALLAKIAELEAALLGFNVDGVTAAEPSVKNYIDGVKADLAKFQSQFLSFVLGIPINGETALFFLPEMIDNAINAALTSLDLEGEFDDVWAAIGESTETAGGTSLWSNLNGLDTRVTTLEADVQTLKDKVEALEKQIQSVNVIKDFAKGIPVTGAFTLEQMTSVDAFDVKLDVTPATAAAALTATDFTAALNTMSRAITPGGFSVENVSVNGTEVTVNIKPELTTFSPALFDTHVFELVLSIVKDGTDMKVFVPLDLSGIVGNQPDFVFTWYGSPIPAEKTLMEVDLTAMPSDNDYISAFPKADASSQFPAYYDVSPFYYFLNPLTGTLPDYVANTTRGQYCGIPCDVLSNANLAVTESSLSGVNFTIKRTIIGIIRNYSAGGTSAEYVTHSGVTTNPPVADPNMFEFDTNGMLQATTAGESVVFLLDSGSDQRNSYRLLVQLDVELDNVTQKSYVVAVRLDN